MHGQILCGRTAVATRRLRSILGSVLGRDGWMRRTHEVKLINTAAGNRPGVDTHDRLERRRRRSEPNIYVCVKREVTNSSSLCSGVLLVTDSLPQTVAQHLRWIMQKDLLGQDVFLIGPPGPLRRSIAMQYLELTRREVEYVALSRDTTETDLKQRREIRSGTAFYIDQCAVRAATQGRVLVLEGLEKAERNVLPVLNNLLENREMQLEDGRFLMSAERYDKLLQEHTTEELDSWKIVRVSEDFRVIALGLPVPKYQGNPLDPPLRSRFQARDIYHLPFKDQLELLYTAGPNVAAERVSQLLSLATTLCSQESSDLGLPDFPVDNLLPALHVLNAFPMLLSQQLLHRLYPYNSILGKDGRTAVEGVLSRFELLDGRRQPVPGAILSVSATRETEGRADVTSRVADKDITFQVPAGTKERRPPNSSPEFIRTPSHCQLLSEMMQSHMVKDICLIGAKGCGKSVLAREFAEMLGYSIEPVMLYQVSPHWFLPSLARASLEKSLSSCSVQDAAAAPAAEHSPDLSCTIHDGVLTIGSVSAPVFNTKEKMKVPDVLFYDNPQHMKVMEDMLKDFLLGEHLLLVGNQGVGKNKIVDRFLHLLNRPREYLQLHRDTTVQTLTLQPSVRDGIITYEDSPLVS
ncbi:hypothetical protein F2P81_021643 [Scophthalmus maximus]|uniref:ATPase dynein-related AAA domain-containing protein n=1 Tax=Scophthalmus maximus TaxID=52904 RepID=A0A6A4RVX1_SCOMX|nr:hypothetical protein F2P81_021643 [Scophthalmus maximus]